VVSHPTVGTRPGPGVGARPESQGDALAEIQPQASLVQAGWAEWAVLGVRGVLGGWGTGWENHGRLWLKFNKSSRVGSRGRSRRGCSGGDAELGGAGMLPRGSRAGEGTPDSPPLRWETRGGHGELRSPAPRPQPTGCCLEGKQLCCQGAACPPALGTVSIAALPSPSALAASSGPSRPRGHRQQRFLITTRSGPSPPRSASSGPV